MRAIHESKALGWRHAACVVLVGVLLGAPLVEGAGARSKRTERQVEDQYTTPAAIVEVGDFGVYACSHKKSANEGIANVGCVEFPVKPSERFLKLEVVDASGLPAPVWVVQEGTTRGGPVCGRMQQPMEIAAGVTVVVWIYPHMASPLCPGLSTTGTVRATFSNLP